jgi:hypothetical protein
MKTRTFVLVDVALSALAVVITYFTATTSIRATTTIVVFFLCVLVGVSLQFFRWLRRRLPLMTSLVAVSVGWAFLAFLQSVTSPHCPFVTTLPDPRCTLPFVAANTATGLLLPLVPALFILPARYMVRVLYIIYMQFRKKVAVHADPTYSATSSRAPGSRANGSRAAHGRTTPKGTKPLPTKKRGPGRP